VLCDPSYEVKTRLRPRAGHGGRCYAALATGTYAVWYPIIPRPRSARCAQKLKTLANKAGKSSGCGATLTVKISKLTQDGSR